MKMGKLEKLFVNGTGHSQNVSRHAAELLRHVPMEPGQRYLDVGSGNGAAPIHVAQTFHLEVTGIDVDAEQITIAKASSQGIANVRFMTVDGRQLPFEDGEFDVVFTNKVTHHIPNWLEALAEMVRVLKPGGYLIYSDLVVPSPAARLGQMVAGRYVGFPTRRAVDAFAATNEMTTVHLSTSLLHYEGVFRKRSYTLE